MISSLLPRPWSFVYLLFWFCNSLFFFEFDIVDIALPWLELYLFQPFCCFAPYFLSCLSVVMFSPLTLFSILQIFQVSIPYLLLNRNLHPFINLLAIYFRLSAHCEKSQVPYSLGGGRFLFLFSIFVSVREDLKEADHTHQQIYI